MARIPATLSRLFLSDTSYLRGLGRFSLDCLRCVGAATFPLLYFRLGEKLACLKAGAYATEILGVTIITDIAITAFVMVPLFRRGIRRLLKWILFAEGWFDTYR